jgi:MinD-like ATPase involved in chromosome partitioning or flagellar assembly
MKTIMFYSYKGGSGRTVAAANVAAALAKLGKRVGIIDLDFEAPGLQHVVNADDTPQFKNGVGVQHYLKSEIDLFELVNEVVIDLFADEAPLSRFKVPPGAQLVYVMASPNVRRVDAQEPKVPAHLMKLVERLRDKYSLDYLIIDAASGIRETYSLAADISNELLVFFRWSRQHVEGTLRLVRIMSRMNEINPTPLPFKLIASASPSERELESIPDADTRDKLLLIKDKTRKRIEETLREYSVKPATIFHEIPEMIELKWRETITVFRDDASPYESLARKLFEVPE